MSHLSYMTSIAILVPDYDVALKYYCDVLGFHCLEDTTLSNTKRWVRIAPTSTSETSLLLAKAVDEKQIAAIGQQAGGRVFLFLQTLDFHADFQRLRDAGVEFLEAPRSEPYGRVAVFQDIFGNKWDLIETIDRGS